MTTRTVKKANIAKRMGRAARKQQFQQTVKVVDGQRLAKRPSYFRRYREERSLIRDLAYSAPSLDTGRNNRKALRALCYTVIPLLSRFLISKDDRKILRRLRDDYLVALNIVHLETGRKPVTGPGCYFYHQQTPDSRDTWAGASPRRQKL